MYRPQFQRADFRSKKIFAKHNKICFPEWSYQPNNHVTWQKVARQKVAFNCNIFCSMKFVMDAYVYLRLLMSEDVFPKRPPSLLELESFFLFFYPLSHNIPSILKHFEVLILQFGCSKQNIDLPALIIFVKLGSFITVYQTTHRTYLLWPDRTPLIRITRVMCSYPLSHARHVLY